MPLQNFSNGLSKFLGCTRQSLNNMVLKKIKTSKQLHKNLAQPALFCFSTANHNFDHERSSFECFILICQQLIIYFAQQLWCNDYKGSVSKQQHPSMFDGMSLETVFMISPNVNKLNLSLRLKHRVEQDKVSTLENSQHRVHFTDLNYSISR